MASLAMLFVVVCVGALVVMALASYIEPGDGDK